MLRGVRLSIAGVLLLALPASVGLCGEPPAVAPAAAARAASAAPTADEPPLSVSSDRAVSQRAGKDAEGRELTRVRFSGRVEAVRGDVRLKCAELEVLFAREKSDAGGGDRGRAREARATGQVTIAMPGSRAVAEEAGYDVAGERIVLSGRSRPVVYHDGDAVAAESFVLHRLERVVEARGRTSAVIGPREAAAAAGAGREGLPSAARKTRIDSAGGAIYDDGQRLLFMRGGVVVQQEGLRLSCERLWAYFAEAGEGGKPPAGGADGERAGAPALGSARLRKLVVDGGVRLETATRIVTAELAEYDAAAGTVVLAGGGGSSKPEVREGGNRLVAPQIVYHLKDDRLEPRGGPFEAVVEADKGRMPSER